MKDEQWTEEILNWAASLVLAARGLYLASGANPLKHWGQLEDRLVAACRTTSNVRSMATKFIRGLNIATSSAFGDALLELDSMADTPSKSRRAVRDIHANTAYVVALARARNEEKKNEANHD